MSIIGVDYGTIGGGGGYEEGEVLLPMASSTFVNLGYQPSAVYLVYVNSATPTINLIAYGDGVTAISGDTTNGSSGTQNRCTLTPTSTGFTVAFTASNVSYWQNNNAKYIAIK